MKFLLPEFLFGLFAIAIPIIVHLFKFRKAKKVYFSNTRFIQEVKKTTSSKRRLKHLLILVSRILFIAFLVFAFAQPFIPSRQGATSVNQVYFYVDNSLSMTNTLDNSMTGLDDALATVDKLINLYPANTDFKLLTNDFSPSSSGLKSKDEVREMLTEVRRSDVSRSFDEIYSRLLTDLPGDASGNKEIYFISDFQKSTLGNISLDVDSMNRILLMPKTFPSYNNVFIDSVFLENPFLMGEQTNTLFIILRNIGTEELDDIGLKFYVNDIQVSSSTFQIEANDRREVAIELSMPLEKINRVRVEIEEFPITFDNELLLILNKSNRIKITEIKNMSSVSPIEMVFGNTDLFNFNSQDLSNIDYSQVSQADLVVLNEIPNVEQSLLETIKSYVLNGGTILIIPGENTNISSLQNLTDNIISKSGTREAQDVKNPDINNPFFEDMFEETKGNILMPKALPVINWQNSRRSILQLKNNDPFISEIKNGLYLMSSPLKDEFTNFAKHALFVPIMYKIASQSKDVTNSLYFSTLDGIISLTLDSLDRKAIYKLTTENNEIIPGQNISGNQLILQLPMYTLEKNFYDLTDDDRYLTTIALNIDKNESLLASYSREELDDIFAGQNNVSIFEAPDSKDAESEIRKLKFGTTLWKYALMLSLLFLLCEVLLIRFFK